MRLDRFCLGLTVVVPLLLGAAGPAPDYVWRRPALTQPRDPASDGNGRLALSDSGECYLVRTSDGILIRTFAITDQLCYSGVPSSQFRYLALATDSRFGARYHVYQTGDWVEVFELRGRGLEGFWVPAFSPDERFLILGGDHQAVYETATWNTVAQLEGHGPPSISPDSTRVALFQGGFTTPVHIYRLEDGVDVTPASGYPTAFPYLLANEWIALKIGDEIRIQSLNDPPQLIANLSAPGTWSLTLSPDGTLLAAVLRQSSGDYSLQIWETQGFSSVEAWPISSGPADSAGASFVSNDSIASTSYRLAVDDPRIDLWDANGGGLIRALNVDARIATQLLFSPDGSTVVAAFGSEGMLRLWDALDGSPLGTVDGSGSLTSLAFSDDGAFLVGGGARVNVWSWPDGKLLQSLSESAQQIAVSSQAVVAQRTQDEIRLRSLPDLALLQVIRQSAPVAFSPDGNLIEVGRDLYDVSSGTLVRSFPAEAAIQDAIFSPDGGNVILSASRMLEQEIERFDVKTGDPVAQFGSVSSFFYAFIGSFSFAPDGSRLAEIDISATLRTTPYRLRVWDGMGGLYEDYSEDIGFGGGWAQYSPDGQALAVALDRNRTYQARVFGVARDPCADGTCVPNRLLGR